MGKALTDKEKAAAVVKVFEGSPRPARNAKVHLLVDGVWGNPEYYGKHRDLGPWAPMARCGLAGRLGTGSMPYYATTDEDDVTCNRCAALAEDDLISGLGPHRAGDKAVEYCYEHDIYTRPPDG